MFQIQCKLFVFDKTSQSWVERGRGLLRLNDMASTDDGTLQSRLGELQGALCRGCRVPKAVKSKVPTRALHPRSREAGPRRKFPSTHALAAAEAAAASPSATSLFLSVKMDTSTWQLLN